MSARVLVVDDSATIRKVVSGILDRHGYESVLAVDGEDALEALASGGAKIDLVLLDFVMPRMNGYQFCRELRANAELALTPVVLMSARADRIRDKFVEQTGALDVITKPFDAQALVAVVDNALRRVNAGRSSSTRLPDLPDDDLEDDAEDARDARGRGASDTSDDAMLRGDVSKISMGAILQLLQVESQSGTLRCRNGDVDVAIAFRHGLIDVVRGTGAGNEFRLGRFLVEEGWVTPEEIEAVLQASPTGHRATELPRLGMKLQNAGKITETQLRTALARQASELVYEVLRWSKGSFELRRELPVEHTFGAPSERLALPVTSVVMEGFRRVDEWRVLEDALGSFDTVLVRDGASFETFDASKLDPKERAVLDAVDGQRTIRAILTESRLSNFETCRVLATFLEARVVRKRGAA